MAIQLFVNTGASALGSALVRGVADNQPIALGELVVGDGKEYELFFVDGKGNYEPWSGNAAYIPYIAIGQCGYPSGGTFTVTFGANTTAALGWNISAAALQTALQGLASIGSGNVSVVGTAGQYYVVTFIGALAGTNVAELVANFANLTPASTIDVSTIVVGGSGVNEVQLLSSATNPITFADDWTTIENGWTGKLSIRTLEIIEAFSAAGGTLTEVFQITVADPVGTRTTFLKIATTIQCTIINPESFAGADKPLLATQAALNAAVLGNNNFTREALTSSGTGNTNITRTATSRHHSAIVSITGTAGTRTLSILTSNSPVAGDTILLTILPAAVPGFLLEVHNATSAGTLLATVTTVGDAQPYFVVLNWTGSAWQVEFSSIDYLAKIGNLAGLADNLAAKTNLRTLFSRTDGSKVANFTILEANEGTLFRVSTAGGAILATLPDPAVVGSGFLIGLQKSDGSTNVMTTDPALITLNIAGQTVVLESDGTEWFVVYNYNPGASPSSGSSVVLNRFDITGLTGGTSTDLDGIATASGATVPYTTVFLAFGTPRAGQTWQLIPGVNADDVDGGIVRPDDFDSSTNPYVWIRLM